MIIVFLSYLIISMILFIVVLITLAGGNLFRASDTPWIIYLCLSWPYYLVFYLYYSLKNMYNTYVEKK